MTSLTNQASASGTAYVTRYGYGATGKVNFPRQTHAPEVPRKNERVDGFSAAEPRESAAYSNSTPKRLARLGALSRFTSGQDMGIYFNSVPAPINLGQGCERPGYVILDETRISFALRAVR